MIQIKYHGWMKMTLSFFSKLVQKYLFFKNFAENEVQ